MNVIRKLNYLLDKKMKLRIIGVFFLIIIGSFAELLGVAIVLPIVNLAMDNDYKSNTWCKIIIRVFNQDNKDTVLLILVCLTILIYIAKDMYLSWMYSRLYATAAIIKKSMSVKLLSSYMKEPYSFFVKKNSAELVRSLNTDIGQFYEVIVNILNVASCGLTALVLLITLIITNPIMTLIVFILLSICALVIIFFIQKKTRRYGRENQRLASDLLMILQQIFSGIKEIKVLNNGTFFVKKFENTYHNQAENTRKYSLVNVIPKYLIEMVCISGIMLYLAINIMFNKNYESIIPQLAVFVAAAYKLLPTVNSLYAYFNSIIYSKVSIDYVYDNIKETEKNETNDYINEKEILPVEFHENIQLDKVHFEYDESSKVILKKEDLEIKKGSSVAFIGPSGGGKTTTADLILGLLCPQEGKVYVDGINIADNISGWRSNIGYIPQTIYLSDDTIKRNVAWGIEDSLIDEKKVIEALKGAQLDDYIGTLPEGINTIVGEHGSKMSGGQRQRLGIARALYRNPEVLVFDEATSALDNDTEKEVMRAINALHGTKTIIMIAHRLSTIENCDRVYKIEDGHIIKVK